MSQYERDNPLKFEVYLRDGPENNEFRWIFFTLVFLDLDPGVLSLKRIFRI